jgi:hypothetical protein
VVSVIEKALPSGFRKPNMAGTPGQREHFDGVDAGFDEH